MTLQDFVEWLDAHPWPLAAGFVVPPLLTWIIGRLHGRGGGASAPWKHCYSLLVYLVCIPGICAAVMTAYSMFFTSVDLMQVPILVYALPVVSMFVTLVLTSKNVAFDDIPGFDRLSGLMVLIGVSFAIALVIKKTRIWILFGGSIFTLLAIAVFAFALLKWGTHAMFRRRDEANRQKPTM